SRPERPGPSTRRGGWSGERRPRASGAEDGDGPPADADGPSAPCGAPRRAGEGAVVQAAVGAVNSASMEILTSSATSTPPASRAAFQVSPKSLREIDVSPVKPAR